MACRLSMLNLSAALIISAAACLGAPVGATPIRQAGAPLDTSIRNEADHAVDLASTWLTARQREDGAWGAETGRVERTALALLALTARADRHSDAVARAAVWLDRHAPCASAPAETHAWRLIALLSAAPAPPDRSALTRRLLDEARPHAPPPEAPVAVRLLWDDALRLAGEPPAQAVLPEAPQLLARHAAAWPPPLRAPSLLWDAVHLINRLADGALLRNGEPLDWRTDAARELISLQRRDPAGGAYWGPEDGDTRIRETAFGLLVLHEL